MVPARPERMFSKDGKYELVPNIEIYRVTYLDPRSTEEAEKHKNEGPIARILYSAKTYDIAVARSKELIADGSVKEHRIEWIYADKDLLRALFAGDFTVKIVEQGS